jgi:hypothetical protein
MLPKPNHSASCHFIPGLAWADIVFPIDPFLPALGRRGNTANNTRFIELAG